MDNRDDNRYRHFAPIYEKTETHGGEDVAVYAIGNYVNFWLNCAILYETNSLI